MNFEKVFRYTGDKELSLEEWRTDETLGMEKKGFKEVLGEDIQKLQALQDVLYASHQRSILLVFQAMDAAGKDGTIKHVMSGINPQGCQVTSFKAPTSKELDHDFLWRVHQELPEKGRIGIFNRSYYEEVLVTKVHPELIVNQRIPGIASTEAVDKRFWTERYEQLRNYEAYLTENGMVIIKFFLHLSKEEQKNRFLSRIDIPEKNWKFSSADLKERAFWEDYQQAFEDAIQNTSTGENPWYIIPADNKWFTRLAVSKIIIERLKKLELKYPEVSAQKRKELLRMKEQLLQEKEKQ